MHHRTTHGLCKNPIYDIWRGMKARCCYKNLEHFPYYAARGITVCPEWKNDPQAFVDWANDNGYKKGLQIDRVDNDLGYSPENCRFVTSKVNNRNKRNSKWWWLHGTRYDSASQAAKAFGVAQPTITFWCDGRLMRGIDYPPKPGCYSELKYSTTIKADGY